MGSTVVTDKEGSLPLASLRLLVPPFQLLSASMWQILKQKDVMSYRKVSEFVSFVMEAVPELLLFKHWTQLTLGLRARFILELCRRGEDKQLILSYLENMTPQHPTLHKELSDEDKAGDNFAELIHGLLKDKQESQIFFQEVWCEVYGPQFDCDLQTLFWEFLGRLYQLLPVPKLEQTVLWLGGSCILDDFLQRISEPANMKNLLHHHKQLGHLEQHVPPSSMGDHISSSLLAACQNRLSKPEAKCILETESGPSPGSNEELQQTLSVEEAAMEIFTVTECAEIELTASAADIEVVVIDNTAPDSPTGEETVIVQTEDVVKEVKESGAMEENNGSAILKDESQVTASSNIEVVFIDNTISNDAIGEETVIALPEAAVKDVKGIEAMEEKSRLAILKDESLATASSNIEVVFIDNTISNDAIGEETVIVLPENVVKDVVKSDAMEEDNASAILKNESQATDHKRSSGPHDCPDCDKKFKFASFLVAHRVIHTGERPHKCSECGQCFSFRQSLERHRHTHKTGKSFECAVCHECFPSSADRSVHKQTHTKDGVYDCQQCSEKFTQELALVRHMKTHSDVNGNEETVETNGKQEAVLTQENVEEKATEPVEERSKKAKSEFKIPASQVIDAQLMNKVISLVQVRTSRRKRKATKKVRNLQKKLESQKEAEKAKDGETKPVQPLKSSDHSYGTTITSSKKGGITKVASSYSCPHCDYRHSEEDQVQQHISDSHSDCPGGADKKQTTEAPAEETEGHKTLCKFKCSVCGQLFKSLIDRNAHITSAHMRNGLYFCSQCDKNFTWRGAFVRHVRMYCSERGTTGFPCPRCELVFDCASALYSHVQTHQEQRVHVCNCGKSFAYKAALTAHQRTHQKERPHVCHQCGKGFLYKGGLLGHMKIHSQELPFTCSHCGKGFKRERNMKKHERCHTREDVFKCSQCDKSFVYKATLTRHELTHTGERPYLCSDCGKGFFSHAELLKHERFHTGKKPFECPHCGKKFTQSCYLTIHLRYHTGAKPYACSECEKSFLSANRLKRHQRTHTGEKPYVCGECGKGFRQSYHLKLHQRTHVIDLT